MKKTGAILKEAREQKGVSIYEVSAATKINTKNLMAMEEGATDRLPPKTFLRGFVASYANYLQLDTSEILKTFFEEMGSTRPEVAIRDKANSANFKGEEKRKNETDKSVVASLSENKKAGYFKIYGIIGIVILIVIIGIIKRKMDSYESESIPQVASNLENPALQQPKNTPNGVNNLNPVATPSPAPVVVASPTPTPIATPIPTPKPTPTPSPAPTATPTPKPTPIPKPSTEPQPTPLSAPKPSPSVVAAVPTTPAPKSASPSPTPMGRAQDVIIEALNDVEVLIQIDNEPSKKMTLHHDEVQSIKARRKVSMKFSDGGAVNLTINGKDKGVPGDLGKPKKVDVP